MSLLLGFAQQQETAGASGEGLLLALYQPDGDEAVEPETPPAPTPTTTSSGGGGWISAARGVDATAIVFPANVVRVFQPTTAHAFALGEVNAQALATHAGLLAVAERAAPLVSVSVHATAAGQTVPVLERFTVATAVSVRAVVGALGTVRPAMACAATWRPVGRPRPRPGSDARGETREALLARRRARPRR